MDRPQATVHVRDAQPEDLGAIVALLAADDLHGDRETPGTEVDGKYVEALAAIADDPKSRILVAEVAGRVVGTFQLTMIRQLMYSGSTIAQVEALYVDSKERSRGVGTAMIQWAVDEAKRRGCLRIQLTSNARRDRAHRFYERLGFCGTHTGFKLHL